MFSTRAHPLMRGWWGKSVQKKVLEIQCDSAHACSGASFLQCPVKTCGAGSGSYLDGVHCELLVWRQLHSATM